MGRQSRKYNPRTRTKRPVGLQIDADQSPGKPHPMASKICDRWFYLVMGHKRMPLFCAAEPCVARYVISVLPYRVTEVEVCDDALVAHNT